MNGTETAATPIVSRARRGDAFFAVFGLAILSVSFFLDASPNTLSLPDGGATLPVTCPFYAATGIDCPMCGLSRSFVELADGEVGSAFARHPAGPLLALAMVAMTLGIAFVTLRRSAPLSQRRGFYRAVRWIGITTLVLGLGRTLVELASPH